MITLARAGPASAMSAKKIRNATAVLTTARPAMAASTLPDGSEDGQIAEGASFAVENWAAAGFWQDLEDGLVKLKGRIPGLKLAFFTWHNRVEGQHAGQ